MTHNDMFIEFQDHEGDLISFKASRITGYGWNHDVGSAWVMTASRGRYYVSASVGQIRMALLKSLDNFKPFICESGKANETEAI